MPIKLINNSTFGVQISLKKYLYSTMVNLVQKESKNVFILSFFKFFKKIEKKGVFFNAPI
jgi:hypothetical protein